MYSDKSFYDLSNILITSKTPMSVSKLATQISKSRGVIYYNLDKMNIEFKKYNLPEINNQIGLGIILSDEQKEVLKNILMDFKYIFNKNERRLIIALFITTYKEKQTTNDFIRIFKTSKNSILSDISYIKEEVFKFNKNLKISYNAKNGYILKGSELIQIQYIYRLIKRITKLKNDKLNNFLKDFYQRVDYIFSDEFNENLMEKMQYLQYRLGKTMSSRAINNFAFSMPYIYLFTKNIKSKTIEKKLSNLKERLEYRIIGEICSVFESEYNIEIEEKLKLLVTLILLCTRKITDIHNISKDYQKYNELATKLIENFEKLGGYEIENKEKAIDQLVTYLKVQYFRNKYNILFVDLDYDKINKEYKDIYLCVQKILKKEKLKFTEYDEANITLHFSLFVQKRKKRIIIVSNEEEIVKKNIVKKLVDNISSIEIVKLLDKRKFEKHNFTDIDLVISTEVDVNTKFNLLLIDTLLSKEDLIKIFNILNN